ncbi:DUF11 domain-containing protein [Variovorax paradoxus]|nr:DUF11 domain-containing protein [Variovorax paradoxus]MBT2300966.1 DUF11 domain-containing protein [Variovorax paradoxus]
MMKRNAIEVFRRSTLWFLWIWLAFAGAQAFAATTAVNTARASSSTSSGRTDDDVRRFGIAAMSDASTKRTAWRSLARRVPAALGAALLSITAHAVPGQPGVPSAPVQIFFEDFQNRPTANVLQLLDDYQGGPAALNSRYNADGYWLNESVCNGIVTSRGTHNEPPCNSAANGHLQLLAGGMGAFHGLSGTALTNETVMASLTASGTAPNNQVWFQTFGLIPVTTWRFLSIRVDTVNLLSPSTPADPCSRPAIFNFSLQGAADTPQAPSSINTCAAPFTDVAVPSTSNSVRGKVILTTPTKTPETAVRLRIRNAETAGATGNDTAFDNVRLLDMSPQLDKVFTPSPINGGAYIVNARARMTFTITNTTDLLAKPDWAFTDQLPAGPVIAPAPNPVATTCASTSIGATPGSSTFTVGLGTLNASVASCTIAVDVTASARGTYTNVPADISPIVGLLPPNPASVTFINEPILRLQKTLPNGRVVAADQFALSIAGTGGPATVTTAGTGSTATGVATLNPATIGAAYTLAESLVSGGGSVLADYTSSYSCTNALAGGQTLSGTATSFNMTPVANDDLTCTFSNTAVPRADLQVVKAASPTAARTGDVITCTLTASNAGPSDANNAVLRDVPGAGLDCTVPSSTATCAASGGASCPGATVPVADLTSPAGVAIPALPAGGSVEGRCSAPSRQPASHEPGLIAPA